MKTKKKQSDKDETQATAPAVFHRMVHDKTQNY